VWLTTLLLTLPLAAPVGAVGAYFISQQRAWVGMIGSVAQSLVLLVLLVLATALHWGYTGIVLAYLAGAAVQGLLMLAFSIGRISLRPSFEFGLAAKLVRTALPLGAWLLLGAIYWRLDAILLSLFVSDADVALYGLAYKVLEFVIVLPGYVLITLLPEFARLASRRDELDRLVQRAFTVMQVAAVPVLVLVVIFANEVIRVIAGGDFEDAAPIVQVLMGGVAITYLSSVFAQALIGLDRQRDLLLLGALLVLPLNIGVNLVLIPWLGTYGAAVAFVITEVVSLATIAKIYGRVGSLPRFHEPVRVAVAAACMAAAGLLKLAPGADGVAPIVMLGAGGALGAALYLGSLYALGAMPREIHINLLAPVWTRLRPMSRV
jgi:O-antigen/teichoic acid export membrane protein